MKVRQKWLEGGNELMADVIELKQNSTKAKAYFRCIAKHLKMTDWLKQNKDRFRVARVHWPAELVMKNLNDRRSYSTPIDRKEAVSYNCTSQTWRMPRTI